MVGMNWLPYIHAQTLSSPPTDPNLGITTDCEFTECDITDIYEIANTVVDLLIWLAVFGFALVIVYSGAQLAIAPLLGKSGDYRSKAKSRITTGLVGLLITLSAYLIVSLGFSVLGYTDDPFSVIDSEE